MIRQMNEQDVQTNRAAFVNKLMLLLLLTTVPSFRIIAQNITIEPYYEKNIFGNQYGANLSWEFQKGIQIGGFYQLSFYQLSEISINSEFSGLYFKVPIYSIKRFSFAASVKSGIVNDRFITIVPALETTLRIINNVSVAGVVSLRARSPALSVKAIIKIY